MAQSIDIETAAYSGAISLASTSGFTYTHDYVRTSDDYSMPLLYINPMSDNGTDVDNTRSIGFEYWNFAYPTMITGGSGAIGDFVSATTGPITAVGISDAIWGDPANMNGWSAPWSDPAAGAARALDRHDRRRWRAAMATPSRSRRPVLLRRSPST